MMSGVGKYLFLKLKSFSGTRTQHLLSATHLLVYEEVMDGHPDSPLEVPVEAKVRQNQMHPIETSSCLMAVWNILFMEQ